MKGKILFDAYDPKLQGETTDLKEQEGTEESKAALVLGGKYARSKDKVDDRQKLKEVKHNIQSWLMQYNPMQCNLVQHNLMQCNLIKYNLMRCNFTQYKLAPYHPTANIKST
jgi:uncharacterized protein YjbI with pentapeptide repeats